MRKMDTRLLIEGKPVVPFLGAQILEKNLISEDTQGLLPLINLYTLFVKLPLVF